MSPIDAQNTHIASSSLCSIFRELKRVAHHPIVFILTDHSSLSALNNPQLLFPLSIVDELKIEQITFNPIAPTFMKKALECMIHHASVLVNLHSKYSILYSIPIETSTTIT